MSGSSPQDRASEVRPSSRLHAAGGFPTKDPTPPYSQMVTTTPGRHSKAGRARAGEPERAEAAVARPKGSVKSRIPGLDGIRALAVVGVLLYHGDMSWMSGGFLGVDVFFVLSGFLVTLLLLGEYERSDGVELRGFWIRRIRRLVPAQLALVVVVVAVTAIFYREDLLALRGQVIAALTATMNWYLLSTDGSYFAAFGRPPVLRHLWSLAIEMQFYVFWPVCFLALMRRWKDDLARVALVILAVAFASAILMAVLFQPGGDPSAAYYNTFSRLTALLLGATLALFWRPNALARGRVKGNARLLDLIGLLSVVLIVVFFFTAHDTSAVMYRGGFAVLALGATGLVAAASHPSTVIGGRFALGSSALVAIGLRSYGVYLWHWPVFAVTRPGVDIPWSPGPTFVLRIVITAVLTEACYQWIERPWHERRVSLRTLFPWRERRSAIPRPALYAGALAAVALIGCSAALATAPKIQTDTEKAVAEGQLAVSKGNQDVGSFKDPTTTAPSTTAPATTSSTIAGPGPTAPTTTAPTTTVVPTGPLPRVTGVGDSVMLGAASGLYSRFPDLMFVDAKVSRQASTGPGIIQALKGTRGLGDVVVVHLGTNGTFSEEDVRAAAAAAAPTKVVFLTVHVDRPWETEVNDTLRRVVPTIPNARLADWHGAAESHPEWFVKDGVHMSTAGIAAYGDLVRNSVLTR